MNDYIDETPLTDEEIAAAIAAAKKAKAEKVRAQKAMLEKAEKPEEPQQTEAKDEESTESLFNEIDSAAENDEKLSPKMASARSFSNAFAAARMRREKDLLKKKAEKAAEQEEEEQSYIEEDVTPAQTYDEDYEEEVVFEADGEYEEYNEEEYGEYEESEGYEEYDNSEEYASEEYVSDEYESEEYATEFEVDGEEDGYENYADEDSGEYEGIFQPDEEDTPNYGERVSVDEYEEYDDEDDDEDDEDEEESTFSTKTKVIIGVIIAVLVLAIIGAGIVFFSKGGDDEPVDSDTTSAADGTEVKSLKFAEPSVSLRVGESVALDIIIEPETATDKTLKLKSNDTSIVTVGEDGKITGVASGSTTVTATLKSNETITATLIVNVINEKQNALNIYNDFVNSILDGSTDIDSDSDTDEAVEDTETDTESNSDTETDTVEVAEDVLTGSIIRDLNGDDALELALLYANKNEGSSVRIFYLADENSDEDVDTEEVMYDEYGNIIESTETDTAEEENTDSEEATVSEKVLTELDIYSEMYSVCYNAIETEAIGWNTCFAEVKEEEVVQARVTILSDEYTSPTYVYETSDETVATVDTQGNIKGIKPGTCFITVTSPLNSEAMAKIKIRVKDDTDLLEDYLAQVPIVNYTNDAVIPTETLTGKAITDIDNDGVSELLLRFSYGNNVETINMVKIENEQCVVYKTYKNLSDLYDFYEGDGSYSNNVLIHYTTGAVCMEYKGIVAKKDSKTKTSEQRIYSVEDNGSLSELVNFTTTTDISTKTVTSEVVIEDTDTSSYYEDSDEWYDSDYYYEDSDSEYYEDTDSSYDDGGYYEESYATFTFDDVVRGGISFADKTAGKTLPQTVGEPEDGDSDYYDDEDYTSSEYDYDEDYDDDEVSKVTSTVTSEIIEESTKYFVNGTPVEQSVYEETLSSYSARYSVWSSWESVY